MCGEKKKVPLRFHIQIAKHPSLIHLEAVVKVCVIREIYIRIFVFSCPVVVLEKFKVKVGSRKISTISSSRDPTIQNSVSGLLRLFLNF